MAAALSGCATLNKNQCLQANWYELGWRDGNPGKARSLSQEHADFPPDLEASFLAGLNEGRKVYKYNKKVVALEKRLKMIDDVLRSRLF